jgi:hypothetical protein
MARRIRRVLGVIALTSLLPIPLNAIMDCYPAKLFRSPDGRVTCIIDHTNDCMWCNVTGQREPDQQDQGTTQTP